MSATTTKLRCCLYCGDMMNKEMRCSRCLSAYYCSQRCQKEHWPAHKVICKPPKAKRNRKKKEHAKISTTTATTNETTTTDEKELLNSVYAAELRFKSSLNDDDDDNNNNNNSDNKKKKHKSIRREYKYKSKRNKCTHEKPKDSDERCSQCQQDDYERTLKIYDILKLAVGFEHDATLRAAFALHDNLSILNKLPECEELLSEISEVCKKRHEHDEFYAKLTHAYAFLRFKQFRFSEAIIWFEKERKAAGSSAELLENAGYAYNFCGNFRKAEECFIEAIALIDAKQAADESGTFTSHRKGDILLGLGVVIQHQGRVREGYEKLMEGLHFFQKLHSDDHSSIADARRSVAKNLILQRKFDKAEIHLLEAVRIFRLTRGQDSPVTANALADLGETQLILKKNKAAEKTLEEALQRGVDVDPQSIHLVTVVKCLMSLRDIQSKRYGKDKSKHRQTDPKYIEIMLKCLDKLRSRGPLTEDADLAVLYKLIGEMMFVCNRHNECIPYLNDSLRILRTVPGRESAELRENCLEILEFVERGVVRRNKKGRKLFRTRYARSRR